MGVRLSLEEWMFSYRISKFYHFLDADCSFCKFFLPYNPILYFSF